MHLTLPSQPCHFVLQGRHILRTAAAARNVFPHDKEEAFEAIAAAYNRYTLLLDTYDPRRAMHTAIEVAQRAQETLGHTLAAVRLDSGDILGDSLYVREQLDGAALTNVRIIASGDLDERKILELLQAGVAIDAFGVGTALGAGSSSPERGFAGGALGAAYKAVWYVDEDGTEHPAIKTAGSKTGKFFTICAYACSFR